ncbi:MAG: DUF1080 domain-containing protein [Pirellulales bacterium]|jgi:hypothetical protein|nr:DUF1080 domain-containing protein [Pirellulales bacterium]HJN65681.1 family 16 glycoside hydrolase [Pirellulales bacterium]
MQQKKIIWFCLSLVLALPAAAGEPEIAKGFFNGKNLDRWQGNHKYWSVQDGMIVGASKEYIPGNEFLWSDEKVGDFYLSFKVKLIPNSGNSGVQFRSRPGKGGFAIGYQADIGKGSWGCLYEEHGRAFLDWPSVGEEQVKPDAWNEYEILAVGHRIWTAINGVISVAIDDPKGALSGQISLQLHAGPPMKLVFADLKLVKNPPLSIAGKNEKELIDALRPRIEKVSAAQEKKAKPTTPFALRKDDTVVFVGGTNAMLASRYGYLESLLSRAAGGSVRFRNMAWQADTVFSQQRPPYFGSWEKQLPRVAPTVIIASFGGPESMAGREKISEFVAAYEKLLDRLSAYADRIVLVSPIPFETPEPPLPDLAQLNESLGEYVAATGDLAARRGYVFVDLFNAPSPAAPDRQTTDGMHLAPDAWLGVAEETAGQLGVAHKWSEQLEPVRALVREKNRLWFNYWRPTNWAFLGGTRMMVPFSQDPSHKVRTFPDEMEEFLPLISALEADISKQVAPQ